MRSTVHAIALDYGYERLLRTSNNKYKNKNKLFVYLVNYLIKILFFNLELIKSSRSD